MSQVENNIAKHLVITALSAFVLYIVVSIESYSLQDTIFILFVIYCTIYGVIKYFLAAPSYKSIMKHILNSTLSVLYTYFSISNLPSKKIYILVLFAIAYMCINAILDFLLGNTMNFSYSHDIKNTKENTFSRIILLIAAVFGLWVFFIII